MEKLVSVSQAVETLNDGMKIMIGGFMTVGTPENLIDAIVEKKLRRLEIICNDAGLPGKGVGKLIQSGAISKLCASHVGLNPDFGKQMSSGAVIGDLIPQGTLAERIRAAGTGLGGFLTPTGVGTEVEAGKEKITIDGKKYILELPLRADVALIKAHTADKSGNLIFRKAARNFNPIMAMAAKYVIVEAELIVETGEIDPDRVMFPGIFVDAVVHAKNSVEEIHG